jgi:ribosomal protein L28
LKINEVQTKRDVTINIESRWAIVPVDTLKKVYVSDALIRINNMMAIGIIINVSIAYADDMTDLALRLSLCAK